MEARDLPYKTCAVLTGILTALLFTLIALFCLRARILSTEEALAAEMFSIITHIGDDSAYTLKPLNSMEFSECSEENLLAMRAALFKSTYAKQIVFHQNGLGICTTGSGVLDRPIVRPPPDFQTYSSAEIWVDRAVTLRLTNSAYKGIVIKIGNYSMMLDSGYFSFSDTFPLDWELVYQNQEKRDDSITIYGHDGLYKQRLWEDGYKPGDSIYYHEECDRLRTHFCMAVATSNSALFGHYTALLSLLGALGISLGFISGLLTLKHLQNRHRVNKRILRGFATDAYYWLYQPIADLKTNQVIGCEVLSRFRDKFGEMLPGEYLPAIRESGQTWRLTEMMIARVFEDLEQMGQIPDDFKVSLNIFPVDVLTGEVNKLTTIPALADSRLSTVIEITEDEYLDAESALANLQAVYESGIQISIDDFGTGYSNLKQLKKINCHHLKIDRSFVMEIEEDSIKSSLIPHVVNIAEQLNLSVIAEGIENVTQQKVLAGLGVRFGQGWVFGKAMTARELGELMKKTNAPASV